MCVLINQELAVVGLINAVAIADKKKKEDRGRFLPGEGIDITPNDVMNYCNFLSFADCGPILRSFDTCTLEKLFESKSKFFQRKDKCVFTIVMEDYRNMLFDYDTDTYFRELRKVLIKEFIPDLNYPRSFLKFMKLCD